MTQELRCDELVELVTDYLEAQLSAAERERFEAHLADCRGCEIYLEQMRQVIRAAGELHEDDMTPEAWERLRRAFRTWKA
jgi:anti-sigma factor RsiW